MRSASQVVALSETDRTDLREHLRFPDSRITVIPNGVPIDGFAPATPEQRVAAKNDFDIEPEAFVLLSISALVPEKGVDVAIRATSALEGCHLLVVGDGPERTALEQLAADVAPGRVTFTGALSEPIDAYRAADVVLLPSLGGDTMPATLIEAGLCGLPSIATPIGAIEEIVLDRTGFIVPPGDSHALAGAIGKLQSAPSLADELGRSARAIASNASQSIKWANSGSTSSEAKVPAPTHMPEPHIHFWLMQDVEGLDDWDPDRDPDRFDDGLSHAVVELYIRLRDRGDRVTIGSRTPKSADLVVVFAKQVAPRTFLRLLGQRAPIVVVMSDHPVDRPLAIRPRSRIQPYASVCSKPTDFHLPLLPHEDSSHATGAAGRGSRARILRKPGERTRLAVERPLPI